MPFTPFHWGPSSWIGLLLVRFINLPAFLIASVIIDIEPFFVLTLSLNYPLHGYLHTYLVGTLVAIILSLILRRLVNITNRIAVTFKVPHMSSFRVILISCLLGVYFHIFLDSFLYEDIKPFYPFSLNPFYGLVSFGFMYAFCGFSLLLGLLLYMRYSRRTR